MQIKTLSFLAAVGLATALTATNAGATTVQIDLDDEWDSRGFDGEVWNTIPIGAATAGSPAITGLLDTTGATTSIGLQDFGGFVGAPNPSASNNSSEDNTNPDGVQDDFFFFGFSPTANGWTFSMVGLNPGLTYNFDFFSHAPDESFNLSIVDSDLSIEIETANGIVSTTAPDAANQNYGPTALNGLTPINFSGSGQFNFFISSTRDSDSGAVLNAFTVTEVPEPSSLALAGLGGLMLLARSRRRRAA